MAGADIRDCFYAVVLPPGMDSFFCLVHDISHDEWMEVTKGSLHSAPLHRVIPCVRVFPMGLNWAFYLVQKLHEQVAIRALQIPRELVFLDGRPSPMLQGTDVATMPYCDNVHVLSLCKEECQRSKDLVCRALEDEGFELHEHEDAHLHTFLLLVVSLMVRWVW